MEIRFNHEQSIAESTLDDCPGVSDSRKQALLRRFGSVARTRRASVEEIAKAPGISPRLAEAVVQFLQERR